MYGTRDPALPTVMNVVMAPTFAAAAQASANLNGQVDADVTQNGVIKTQYYTQNTVRPSPSNAAAFLLLLHAPSETLCFIHCAT